jgi:hypothetical protein
MLFAVKGLLEAGSIYTDFSIGDNIQSRIY